MTLGSLLAPFCKLYGLFIRQYTKLAIAKLKSAKIAPYCVMCVPKSYHPNPILILPSQEWFTVSYCRLHTSISPAPNPTHYTGAIGNVEVKD